MGALNWTCDEDLSLRQDTSACFLSPDGGSRLHEKGKVDSKKGRLPKSRKALGMGKPWILLCSLLQLLLLSAYIQ